MQKDENINDFLRPYFSITTLAGNCINPKKTSTMLSLEEKIERMKVHIQTPLLFETTQLNSQA